MNGDLGSRRKRRPAVSARRGWRSESGSNLGEQPNWTRSRHHMRVNWGEVVGKIYKSQGRYAADHLSTTLQFYGLEIIPAGMDRAARAALLKVDLKLGYADAFCIELAIGIANSVIVTADYDFQVAAALVTLKFLPNNHSTIP